MTTTARRRQSAPDPSLAVDQGRRAGAGRSRTGSASAMVGHNRAIPRSVTARTGDSLKYVFEYDPDQD
jgi:hypothetical protein